MRTAWTAATVRIQAWFNAARRGDLLALLGGALLPLAFAPFQLFPVAALSPALLFAVWLGASPRRAAWRGFLFGAGMFGVGVSWVFVAIHVYGFTPIFPSALLTALFVAVLALYPTLLGYSAARLMRWRGTGEAMALLLLLPVLWTLFEWLRGVLFTGFPWLDLGYSQSDSPLRGLAPLFGVYALSWACAFSGGVLVYALRRRRWWSLAAVALLWGAAWAGTQVQWSRPVGKPLSVALVQGALPQLTKWDEAQFRRRLQTYADLTRDYLGKRDLIIWPENAITYFYRDLKPTYFDPLAKLARAAGTDIVLGVPVKSADGKRYYTTMMSLGSHHAFYYKRHLVPFGEYVPLASLLRGLIAFFDLPMSGFSPGPAQQPPLRVAGQPAAVSICYEDAFGSEFIEDLPQATLLINGSNNAWYGDSLAPHQHLQISRMRAIETARPLLRATTDGITAVIGPDGKLKARAPQFRTYVLSASIQPREGATPYVRWGNRPVMGALLLALVVGLRRRPTPG